MIQARVNAAGFLIDDLNPEKPTYKQCTIVVGSSSMANQLAGMNWQAGNKNPRMCWV